MAIRKYTEEEAKERRIEKRKEYNKRTNFASQTKSNAKNTKLYGLRVTIKSDQDIIDKLENVESISGYLKELIRADIAKNGI